MAAASPSPSGTSSSTPARTDLCVTVERSQASIQRGQKASFTVKVSAADGPATGVSVTLAAQPSGLAPTFTSGCSSGDGTAKCTIGSVAESKTVSAGAQIPVAPGAASVTSVKLTATADASTASAWTPPSAAVTVGVAPVSSRPTSATAAPSTTTNFGPAGDTLALGAAPGDITAQTGQLIGASNASGLFPAIVPSSTPSPSPGVHPQVSGGTTQPVANASALGLSEPMLPAQVAGLVALALGVLLTVTRLSVRRRSRSPK